MNLKTLAGSFVLICLLLLVLSTASNATMVKKLSLEDLTKQADVVLSGKVINVENQVQVDEKGKKVPYTCITVSVDEIIKGTHEGDTYSFRLIGGTLPEENKTLVVPGMPKFKNGQEVVLFLRTKGFPVVGMHQGKYELVVDKATGKKLVCGSDGKPVTEKAVFGAASKEPDSPVNYEVFKSYVKSVK